MNKKGQTLVVFIILMPVILIICALIVDVGIMNYEKTKITNLTKELLQSDNLSEEIIIKTYKNNKIDIDNLKVVITSSKIEIENDYYIESVFGKIINKDKYEIRIKAKKDLKNNKIEVE